MDKSTTTNLAQKHTMKTVTTTASYRFPEANKAKPRQHKFTLADERMGKPSCHCYYPLHSATEIKNWFRTGQMSGEIEKKMIKNIKINAQGEVSGETGLYLGAGKWVYEREKLGTIKKGWVK